MNRWTVKRVGEGWAVLLDGVVATTCHEKFIAEHIAAVMNGTAPTRASRSGPLDPFPGVSDDEVSFFVGHYGCAPPAPVS